MTRDQAAHRITAQRHGQGGGHGPIETATPHGGIHARQAAAAQAANHAQSMHGAHTLHQPGQSTVHHDPTNGIDNALGQFGSEGFSGRAGKPLEKYGREYQQLLDIGRRSSANMTAAQRDRLNAKIREYK
jgi:hypothetical protein